MAPVVHGLKEVYGEYINIFTVDISPDWNPKFYSGLDIDQITARSDELKEALAPGGDSRIIDNQRPYIVLIGPEGNVIESWSYFTTAEEIQVAIITVLNQ
jgi:hypothetical protein